VTGPSDGRARPGRGPTNRQPAERLSALDLVIFDKDGTLIDFATMWADWAIGLADRLAPALAANVPDPRARLYAAIGFDAARRQAIAGGPLAAMTMADLRQFTTDLLAVGSSRAQAETTLAAAWRTPDPVALARPLADLPALFERLHRRGLRVAVATSDDREPTERTLAALGVDGLVDALACADDGLPTKPDAAMILHLCRALAIDPRRSAMVGDAPADLAMGLAAGSGLRIGVLSGVGSRADLEPLADAIIPSVEDLLGG